MPVDEWTTHAAPNFVGATLGSFRRWRVFLGSLAGSVFRRASHSKLFVAAMVGLSTVVVLLAVKFSTVLHVLTRVADVGRNVNGPGAAGAGGVGAGAAGGASSDNNQNPDGCQSEQDAVQGAEDAVQAAQSSIDASQQQLAQLQNQVVPQIIQLQADAFSALAETVSDPTLSGLIGDILVKLQSAGDASSLQETLLSPGGTNPVDFFTALSNLSNAMTVDVVTATGLAQAGGFGGTAFFLQNVSQLQGQLAMANGLLGSVQLEQSNLDQAQFDLQTAQQALADCEAAGV